MDFLDYVKEFRGLQKTHKAHKKASKLTIPQNCDTLQTACFSGSKCLVTQNSDNYFLRK